MSRRRGSAAQPVVSKRRRPRAGSARSPGASSSHLLPAWLGARIAIRFALWLALFLAPWPGLGRAFTVLFCAYANGLLRALGIARGLGPTLLIGDDSVPEWNVLLPASERDGVPSSTLDVRILAYTPLAVYICLVLATPGRLRRKLIILSAGLVLLLARLALGLVVPLARALSSEPPSRLAKAAEVLWLLLINTPAMSYVTPLFLWGALLALVPAKAAS